MMSRPLDDSLACAPQVPEGHGPLHRWRGVSQPLTRGQKIHITFCLLAILVLAVVSTANWHSGGLSWFPGIFAVLMLGLTAGAVCTSPFRRQSAGARTLALLVHLHILWAVMVVLVLTLTRESGFSSTTLITWIALGLFSVLSLKPLRTSELFRPSPRPTLRVVLIALGLLVFSYLMTREPVVELLYGTLPARPDEYLDFFTRMEALDARSDYRFTVSAHTFCLYFGAWLASWCLFLRAGFKRS